MGWKSRDTLILADQRLDGHEHKGLCSRQGCFEGFYDNMVSPGWWLGLSRTTHEQAEKTPSSIHTLISSIHMHLKTRGVIQIIHEASMLGLALGYSLAHQTRET